MKICLWCFCVVTFVLVQNFVKSEPVTNDQLWFYPYQNGPEMAKKPSDLTFAEAIANRVRDAMNQAINLNFEAPPAYQAQFQSPVPLFEDPSGGVPAGSYSPQGTTFKIVYQSGDQRQRSYPSLPSEVTLPISFQNSAQKDASFPNNVHPDATTRVQHIPMAPYQTPLGPPTTSFRSYENVNQKPSLYAIDLQSAPHQPSLPTSTFNLRPSTPTESVGFETGSSPINTAYYQLSVPNFREDYYNNRNSAPAPANVYKVPDTSLQVQPPFFKSIPTDFNVPAPEPNSIPTPYKAPPSQKAVPNTFGFTDQLHLSLGSALANVQNLRAQADVLTKGGTQPYGAISTSQGGTLVAPGGIKVDPTGVSVKKGAYIAGQGAERGARGGGGFGQGFYFPINFG